MKLNRYWHHLLVVLVVEKTLLFTHKRVCKTHFIWEIGNHDPMFTLHIAGLRADNSKSVIVKSWNIVWGERTEVQKFEQRNTIDNLLQSKSIYFQTSFPTTPNLSRQPTAFVYPIQWVQKRFRKAGQTLVPVSMVLQRIQDSDKFQ